MATDLLPETTLETAEAAVPKNRTFYSGGPTSEYFLASSRNDLFVALALCAVFVLTSFNRLNHTDLWGHLNYGRWIVENNSLPTSDPFGAFSSEKPFVNMPWLSQVLGYVTFEVAGVDGLQLAHAALVTVGFAIFLLALFARGVETRWAIVAIAAAYAIGLPIWGTIRPQLFGVIGFPLALWAVTELQEKRHPLFWLAPAFAVWANLHGSFAMGLAVIGIGLVAAAWEAWRAEGDFAAIWSNDRVQRIAIALAVAVAGCCLNPLGPAIFPAVADFSKGEAMKSISEWRTLDLKSLTGVLFIASIGLTWLVSQRSTRSWTALDLLLLVGFGLLCITAMRMIQWWAMVWPWVIAPYAQSAWTALFAEAEAADQPAEAELDEPVTLVEQPSTVGTLLVLAAVFAALLLAPPSHSLLSGKSRGLAAVTSDDTPIYLAEEVARRGGLPAPFVAPIDWADFVVWGSHGQAKPLAYSHVHLVDDNLWKDEQQILVGAGDWIERCDARGVKYLVLARARNKELLRIAIRHPRIEIVYQDQQGVILQLMKPKPKPAAPPAAKA